MTERVRSFDADKLARRCVDICEDRKAENVLLFDVRGTSVLADYYLVCSGTSEPHMRAIRARLSRDLAAEGVRPRIEGNSGSRWIVVDAGSILVHIMDPERRDYYKIEELWNAEQIVYRGQTTADPQPIMPGDNLSEPGRPQDSAAAER